MAVGSNRNENNFLSKTINKDANSFLSELIINENQRFVSDQLRKSDMVAANAKQISGKYNNNSESFISDQSTDPDIEGTTIQFKKKRKHKKRKIGQKLTFQRTFIMNEGSMMMNLLMQKLTL